MSTAVILSGVSFDSVAAQSPCTVAGVGAHRLRATQSTKPAYIVRRGHYSAKTKSFKWFVPGATFHASAAYVASMTAWIGEGGEGEVKVTCYHGRDGQTLWGRYTRRAFKSSTLGGAIAEGESIIAEWVEGDISARIAESAAKKKAREARADRAVRAHVYNLHLHGGNSAYIASQIKNGKADIEPAMSDDKVCAMLRNIKRLRLNANG